MTKRLISKFSVCKSLKGVKKNLWGVPKAIKFRAIKILKSDRFFKLQKNLRLSTFQKSLNTKKSLKHFYCNVQENVLQKFLNQSMKSKANTIDQLIALLEKRIDIVLFRAGFTVSLHMARQLISHQFILKNSVTVKRILKLQAFDQISLNPQKIQFESGLIKLFKVGRFKKYFLLSNNKINVDQTVCNLMIKVLNKKKRNFTPLFQKFLQQKQKFLSAKKFQKILINPENYEVNYFTLKIVFLWDPFKKNVYFPSKLLYSLTEKSVALAYAEILYND